MTTVSQLVERLKSLPQDAIVATNQYGGDMSRLFSIYSINILSGKCLLSETGEVIKSDENLDNNDEIASVCKDYGYDFTPETVKVVKVVTLFS